MSYRLKDALQVASHLIATSPEAMETTLELLCALHSGDTSGLLALAEDLEEAGWAPSSAPSLRALSVEDWAEMLDMIQMVLGWDAHRPCRPASSLGAHYHGARCVADTNAHLVESGEAHDRSRALRVAVAVAARRGG